MRDYKVKPINSLARGLEVLQVLQDLRAASLHDLHLATGIPKSTLTRILHTCHQQGVVWQRMVDGAFLPSHVQQRRTPLDDADWLAEIASPLLEQLCDRVRWPSVLSVPRLDYMQVVETNSRRAYFDALPERPVHFRANMLRSASGRAYLAFCSVQEREAVLRRLRERGGPGHELASQPDTVRRIVETTRWRGYSVRSADFGGHYSLTRDEEDDGRNSIAVPIIVNGQVLGCVNLTWRMTVLTLQQVVDRHLADLCHTVKMLEERAATMSTVAPGADAPPPGITSVPGPAHDV